MIPEKLLQTIAEHGPFAAGALFGGLLATFFHWMASKERIERDKLDQKRESELIRQISLKDERIDALHADLAKALPAVKTTTRSSKAK
jgi:hypothetical protein